MTHSSEAVKPISLICEFNRRIIAKFGLRPITTRQGNHPSGLGTDSPLYSRSLAPTTLVPTFLFRILGSVHFPLFLSYEMARELTYWLCLQDTARSLRATPCLRRWAHCGVEEMRMFSYSRPSDSGGSLSSPAERHL